MRPSTVSILLSAAAALCVARTANAGADRIVLEAYEQDRPADAATLLEPIYDELGKRGYTSGAALLHEVTDRVSHDSGQLTATQIVEAQQKVDSAYQRFIDGDYVRALDAAKVALASYASAPAQLAREPALRDLRYKALLIAARSAEVNGATADAFGYMAEAVRSFPDHPVNSAEFAPAVITLYHRVKDELGRQGLGALDIKVDDPSATIFVDERFVGSGSAKLPQLPPGKYRVYAAKGQEVGRIHEIDVGPNANAYLAIEWSLDSALTTGPGFVGLKLDKPLTGDAEIQVATDLARGLGASSVIILSVRAINGRRAIAGYSISVESQTRAFAAIQIEPISPSADTLKRLAALLAGDKNVAAPGFITTEPPPPTPAIGAGDVEGPRWYDDRVGWILAGAGFLVLGGGGLAQVHASSLYDQGDRQTAQMERQTTLNRASSYHTASDVLFIAGGAALAAGVVKLVLVPDRSERDVAARHPRLTLDVSIGWLGVDGSF